MGNFYAGLALTCNHLRFSMYLRLFCAGPAIRWIKFTQVRKNMGIFYAGSALICTHLSSACT